MNMAISEYIKIYGKQLGIPDNVLKDAEEIINEYADINTLRGTMLEVVACAGILLSCKLWSIPMNAKMVDRIIIVPTKREDNKGYLAITKMARKIARVTTYRPTPLVSVDKYIDLIIIKSGLDNTDTGLVAHWIASKVPETNSTNQVLATTIVYVSAKLLHETITEKSCVSVLKVTEPALRKCKRQLISLGIIIQGRKYYLGGDIHEKKSVPENIQENIPEGEVIHTRGL